MSREVLAGIIDASCTCCPEPRALIHHIQLGPTRMMCPETGRTFLDRGDGVYQADGQAQPVEARATPGGATTTDLLSDRPARTPEKTRISLERATFAGTTSADAVPSLRAGSTILIEEPA